MYELILMSGSDDPYESNTMKATTADEARVKALEVVIERAKKGNHIVCDTCLLVEVLDTNRDVWRQAADAELETLRRAERVASEKQKRAQYEALRKEFEGK